METDPVRPAELELALPAGGRALPGLLQERLEGGDLALLDEIEDGGTDQFRSFQA